MTSFGILLTLAFSRLPKTGTENDGLADLTGARWNRTRGWLTGMAHCVKRSPPELLYLTRDCRRANGAHGRPQSIRAHAGRSKSSPTGADIRGRLSTVRECKSH